MLVWDSYVLDLGRESGDLLLEIGELMFGVDSVLIKWPLHVIQSIKNQIKAVKILNWCVRLNLRLSLWGWGLHIIWTKSKVINLFVNVAIFRCNVLSLCPFFLFVSRKLSFAPSHRLSRDGVFPLHNSPLMRKIDLLMVKNRHDHSWKWKGHSSILL